MTNQPRFDLLALKGEGEPVFVRIKTCRTQSPERAEPVFGIGKGEPDLSDVIAHDFTIFVMMGKNELSDCFKVASGCIEWQDEFQGYHRKDGLIVKTHDDLLSATRVGIMQLRSAKAVPLGSTRRNVSRGPQMASGVDFDPWTGH